MGTQDQGDEEDMHRFWTLTVSVSGDTFDYLGAGGKEHPKGPAAGSTVCPPVGQAPYP